jgi:hypothetical protein
VTGYVIYFQDLVTEVVDHLDRDLPGFGGIERPANGPIEGFPGRLVDIGCG